MVSVKQRLATLEEGNSARSVRIFQQLEDTPFLFRELNSDSDGLYTQAQLDAVSESCQVIKIVYE